MRKIRKILGTVISIAALALSPQLLYGTWLGCRALLCDQFITPTSSMEPTLLPGDRILVDKTIMGARIYSDFNFTKSGQELKAWRTRGKRKIKHNDILVFNYPFHDGALNFVINHVYAKRCVGLPGDTVSIVNGFYKNNNYDPPLGYLPAQEAFSKLTDPNIKNMAPVYIPRKGDIINISPREASLYRLQLEWETGQQIEIDHTQQTVMADGKPFVKHCFLHDYYFMAGDNMADSNDSRYWGVVPEEYIIGVATYISYSKEKENGEFREKRILKKLTYNN